MKRDLTKGAIWRTLIIFSLPMIAGHLVGHPHRLGIGRSYRRPDYRKGEDAKAPGASRQ